LKKAGVTGPGLCWTFFSLRIQPLKAWPQPIWEYSDRFDPTRESEVELPKSEVAAQVANVVIGDAASVFDNHPSPLSLAKPSRTVSSLTSFRLVLIFVCLLPYSVIMLSQSLGKIYSHPLLLEDRVRKAAAAAEAAEKKKKKQEEKRATKEQERHAHRAAEGGSSEEETDDSVGLVSSSDDEGMEAWFDTVLGKRGR
ncbi:hypothetical protein BAE44_0022685, partial [Dichanthelium oligosanthes]